MKNILRLICLFIVAVSFSGCMTPVRSDGRLQHKSFKVDISELDWLEIVYTPAKNDRKIIIQEK